MERAKSKVKGRPGIYSLSDEEIRILAAAMEGLCYGERRTVIMGLCKHRWNRADGLLNELLSFHKEYTKGANDDC